MAIRTRDELMSTLKAYIGEDTSDNALTLIEDINDSFDNLTNNDNEDWKKKYEDNDANWRKKYRDTFFSGVVDEEVEEKQKDDDKSTITIEDLFTEVK